MADNVYTETYKGYKIEIFQDEYNDNPFENWDLEPPMAVYVDRQITEYSTNYGNANEVPSLTRAQILENLGAILQLTESKSVFELCADRYQYSDVVRCINDAISDYVDGLNNCDRLEALQDVYTFAGIPALLKSVCGSFQGDYWEVLAVATPEFQTACGNAPDYWNVDKLKPSIQSFRDWATGNCYGFSVTGPDEYTDSCCGFFGDYDGAEYSALTEAKNSIDYQVEFTRKRRLQLLKTYIKNRVPMQYRSFA